MVLAIDGGNPFISESFSKYNPIQELEMEAANAVLASGVLSDFLGSAGDKFLGGSRVLAFEKAASERFGSKYCISFNSWTSGLTAMVGSLPGLKAGTRSLQPRGRCRQPRLQFCKMEQYQYSPIYL